MRNYLRHILLFLLTNSSILLFADNLPVYSIKPNSTMRLGKTNLFNQLYFESGVKFSSNTDTVGNLNNTQFGLKHAISKKISFFHAYNYLTQNIWWGAITQQAYYANLEYKVNARLKFNVAGSYLHSRSKINPAPIDPNLPPPTTPPQVSYINDDNGLYLVSSTIGFGHFYAKPMFVFSQLNNQGVKQDQIQTGGELYFDVKNNEAYVFGFGVYHFSSNNNISTFIKPSISWILNDELTLSADYLYTNARNFSDQDGYVVYNSVDKTIDRVNAILKYEFANNLFLYTVYQYERKQDYFTTNNYNFNSIFLGIKYNK